jgi:hypothetical protein
MTAILTLAAAAVALGLWFVLTFAMPVGLGVVHLLLGLGAWLLIRWWVVREPGGTTGATRA